MTTETTVDDLNELTEICHDGELGYLTAAEHVDNSELKTIFTTYAKQRAEFVRDLDRKSVV